MLTQSLILIGFVVFLAILLLFFFVSRYKRCPSDKILVVYGKTGGEESAKCYAGGAAFVWPVIQDYKYLDLTPISIDVNLQDALSKQNIRVSVPAQFTVGVSNKPNLMLNAAERLLGLDAGLIKSLSHDIIMGQMRLVIANMDIEELNTDRDKFVDSVYKNVGQELNKVGLELINVNVTDIQDESGYIQALGQEAAAKAINDAKVKVSIEERAGAIGQAEAVQEQRTKVAAANSKADVGEAQAAAQAVAGKNTQAALIAESDAELAVKKSEADKRAEVANKVAKAEAEQASYQAQEQAFIAKAKADLAEKQASEVVESKIAQEKIVIDAEAAKEKLVLEGKAKAESLLAVAEAKAKEIEMISKAKAEGIKMQVDAAGGAEKLAMLNMIDNIVPFQKVNAEAMKNVEFGDVTVIGTSDTASDYVGKISSQFMGIDKAFDQIPMGKAIKALLIGANGNGSQEATNGSPAPADKVVETAEVLDESADLAAEAAAAAESIENGSNNDEEA